MYVLQVVAVLLIVHIGKYCLNKKNFISKMHKYTELLKDISMNKHSGCGQEC